MIAELKMPQGARVEYRTDWPELNEYRLHLLISKEDDEDVYSAIVLSLPGIGGQGITVEEAIDDAKLAFKGALESYLAHGEEIPWRETNKMKPAKGERFIWVTVNA